MKPKKPINSNDQMLAELEEKWKRALADYQNLEKRTKEQQQWMAKLASITLLQKLLPILDDLKRALSHFEDQGLKLVVSSLEKLLAEEGLVRIEALGKPFDAKQMECVDTVEGEKDVVIKILIDGYRLENQVVRPAKVMVGKGKI